MPTYTEQPGNSTTYGEAFPGETAWDAGATEWDVVDSLATTFWDVVPQPDYVATSGNTPTWTEQ